MQRQITPVVRKLIRFSGVNVRASSEAAHGHHKSDLELARENHATLNDLPIPAGSWQENYNKRNSKWNMFLGASILCLAITAVPFYREISLYNYPMSEMKKANISAK